MINKKNEGQINDFKEKALATISVFSSHQTILGLPANVFVMGAGITLVIALVLYWLLGILFGCVYFIVMYHIHKDDPKAFFIWKKAMTRYWHNKSNSWQTKYCKTTKLIIIEGEK